MQMKIPMTKQELRNEAINDLESNHNFATLQNTQEMYVYENGIYVSEGKPERLITEAVRKKLLNQCAKNDINEAVAMVKADTLVGADFFDNQDLNLICVDNGILNINFDEAKLEAFDPQYHFKNKIPVNYFNHSVTESHPESEICKHIEAFFRSIVDDGNPLTTELKVRTLYEFFAYCLYRDMPIHKSFMLIGDGSNGKTTLLNLLNTFLGVENIANIDLQSICRDRFTKAELRGKLANIYDDLKFNALYDTGHFKMLTGNALVDAELKFVQHRVKFRSYAKMIFSANKIPPNPNDNSTAFWRRWVIIPFRKTFNKENANCNPNILREITDPIELSGLLWKCTKILKELVEKGEFSFEETVEETKKSWTRDIVKDFISECIENGSGIEYFVPKRIIYEAFMTFCRNNNGIPFDDKTFGMKFKGEVAVRDGQRKVGDIQDVHCYLGIRLKKKAQQNERLTF